MNVKQILTYATVTVVTIIVVNTAANHVPAVGKVMKGF